MRGRIPGDGKPRLDGDIVARPGYDMHAKLLSLPVPETDRNGISVSTRYDLTELLEPGWTDPMVLFGQVTTGVGAVLGLDAVYVSMMPADEWLQISNESRANNGGMVRICVGYGKTDS